MNPDARDCGLVCWVEETSMFVQPLLLVKIKERNVDLTETFKRIKMDPDETHEIVV